MRPKDFPRLPVAAYLPGERIMSRWGSVRRAAPEPSQPSGFDRTYWASYVISRDEPHPAVSGGGVTSGLTEVRTDAACGQRPPIDGANGSGRKDDAQDEERERDPIQNGESDLSFHLQRVGIFGPGAWMSSGSRFSSSPPAHPAGSIGRSRTHRGRVRG